MERESLVSWVVSVSIIVFQGWSLEGGALCSCGALLFVVLGCVVVSGILGTPGYLMFVGLGLWVARGSCRRGGMA